jgi:hypothetical protein
MSLVDDNKLFDKLRRFSRQLFVRAHLAVFPWLSSEEGKIASERPIIPVTSRPDTLIV